MGLDARQQFKFGFLAACADAGLSFEETRDRVKQAADRLRRGHSELQTKTASVKEAIFGTAVNLAKNLGITGLAGSAVLGAGGGYLAAKMTETDASPEEAKTQELIAAYQQMADRARRSMQMRRYRQPTPSPTGPRLMH